MSNVEKSKTKEEKLTVEKTAKIMECTPQFLRLALQQGMFDFGVAVKTSNNRYTYHINIYQFYKYIGMSEDEELTDVRLTIEETAEKMDCTPHFLRLALQQGKYDFGVAVKTSSNRFTYYINGNKFYEYMGIWR